MSRVTKTAAAVIAIAFLVFHAPSKASAAGVILITHGDTINHVGNVPAQNLPGLPMNKVGFRYGYAGVFWVDVWTWGGTYCLYEDKRYVPLTVAEAAELLGKSESDLHRPWLYSFPPGAVIVGGLMAIGIIASVREKRRKNFITGLFQDQRYQEGLKVMHEEYAKRSPAAPVTPGASAAEVDPVAAKERYNAAFEAGVQHLVGLGVPRKNAERNFTLMVQVFLQMQARQPAPQTAAGPAAVNEAAGGAKEVTKNA